MHFVGILILAMLAIVIFGTREHRMRLLKLTCILVGFATVFIVVLSLVEANESRLADIKKAEKTAREVSQRKAECSKQFETKREREIANFVWDCDKF